MALGASSRDSTPSDPRWFTRGEHADACGDSCLGYSFELREIVELACKSAPGIFAQEWELSAVLTNVTVDSIESGLEPPSTACAFA